MGSAMGALLHQRSIVPLHAGAVSVDGGAVLFAGPSSIGKSALATAFQNQGYPILADDVCAVSTDGTDLAKVIPGFPRLKLWANALKKLETQKTGLDATEEQIEKALSKCTIEELQRQEKENGFHEKSPASELFFRKGRVGSWQEELTDIQAERIVRDHRPVMTRFGYL